MSDRCYLTITMAKVDAERLEEGGDLHNLELDGLTIAEDKDGIVRLEDEGANYSLYGARDWLADAGVPFYGNHSAGFEYEAAVFASDGKRLVDVNDLDGYPVARVDRDGECFDEDMAKARLYWRTREEAERLVAEQAAATVKAEAGVA